MTYAGPLQKILECCITCAPSIVGGTLNSMCLRMLPVVNLIYNLIMHYNYYSANVVLALPDKISCVSAISAVSAIPPIPLNLLSPITMMIILPLVYAYITGFLAQYLNHLTKTNIITHSINFDIKTTREGLKHT